MTDVRTAVGPFEMLSPRGFLDDEGMRGMLAFVARSLSRRAYLRRLAWLMPRMARAVPYLGYIAVVGTRPDTTVKTASELAPEAAPEPA